MATINAVNGGFPHPSALGGVAEGILARGRMASDDVLELRRALYADGKLNDRELDLVFRLHEEIARLPATFETFYVEALADYFFWKRDTDSRLTPADEALLIESIRADGRIAERTELPVLVKLVERSNGATASFRRFVLDALAAHVQAQAGPAGARPALDAATVKMIRGVLYGMASGGGPSITREEADFLFSLNAAIDQDGSDASWEPLFAKAITMHLLFRGHSPEEVDDAEAAWLKERLLADGGLDDSKTALLAYLRQEANVLAPALRPVLDELGTLASR